MALSAVLPACVRGQAVLARDSIESKTMRSAIFIRSGRRGYSLYLDGHPATDSALSAAFRTFPQADSLYMPYEKMMSHETSIDKTYLIGIGSALMLLPLFSLPAVYKSDVCQGAEITLFAGWFGYGLGWHIVARCKIGRAVRHYNYLLFTRDGLPTRNIHHRIKQYYGQVFGIF